MSDKSKWPVGPWHDEQDHYEWRDKATGMPCIIHRNPSGALCGYVGVQPGHKLHASGYDEANELVSVHGGLTYSEKCRGAICHVPAPGESDDVRWFGFDCAHCDDVMPAYSGVSKLVELGCVYRTVEYVRAECAKLAQQLSTL